MNEYSFIKQFRSSGRIEAEDIWQRQKADDIWQKADDIWQKMNDIWQKGEKVSGERGRKVEANKKELIREAAVRVMAREGFYNTRTAWIAEEAGVAVGTIYNYFQSKEAILEYIFEIELKKRLAFLENASTGESGFLDKLERFLRWHFQEVKNNPDSGKILVREKDFTRRNEQAPISGYLNQIPLALEDLLKGAAVSGEISGIHPRVAAAVIFGAIQGVVEKAVYSGDEVLLEEATGEIMRLLLARSN